LWKDRAAAPKAAEALKITARNLLDLELVDEVVPEPLGGAHNDRTVMSETLKTHLLAQLDELEKLSVAKRLKQRYQRFRAHGHVLEKPAEAA
jgi:acetyl-CoA carboxylase carboxyl transferase subunit alpha